MGGVVSLSFREKELNCGSSSRNRGVAAGFEGTTAARGEIAADPYVLLPFSAGTEFDGSFTTGGCFVLGTLRGGGDCTASSPGSALDKGIDVVSDTTGTDTTGTEDSFMRPNCWQPVMHHRAQFRGREGGEGVLTFKIIWGTVHLMSNDNLKMYLSELCIY